MQDIQQELPELPLGALPNLITFSMELAVRQGVMETNECSGKISEAEQSLSKRSRA